MANHRLLAVAISCLAEILALAAHLGRTIWKYQRPPENVAYVCTVCTSPVTVQVSMSTFHQCQRVRCIIVCHICDRYSHHRMTGSSPPLSTNHERMVVTTDLLERRVARLPNSAPAKLHCQNGQLPARLWSGSIIQPASSARINWQLFLNGISPLSASEWARKSEIKPGVSQYYLLQHIAVR